MKIKNSTLTFSQKPSTYFTFVATKKLLHKAEGICWRNHGRWVNWLKFNGNKIFLLAVFSKQMLLQKH